MTRSLYIVMFVFFQVSCRETTSLTERDKKDVINEVSQTLKNYYNDIRTSGLIAEFKYLDSSADFFWVPPGYRNAISYDSVAAVLKQSAPQYRSVDNRFDSLQIKPLSRELASYTGRLTSTMTDTTGKVLTYSLIETGILIKRKDGWKLLNGQTAMLAP